jgi:alanine racemase
MSRTALATIHLDALRRNLARVRELSKGAKVMAVVKADGYGHGLERVARALGDADALGVAALGDGLRLRAAGHKQRIVVLSGPDEPGDLTEFRRLQLDAVIHHVSQVEWLAADRDARPLRVWLKLDSGMHRLGFAPERIVEMYTKLRSLPNIAADIVLMTHFAASDEFDNAQTTQQIDRFVAATAGLDGTRTLANSAGLLGWPAAYGAGSDGYWVRAGGLLYGLSVIDGKSGADLGFAPAMTLSTKLIAINRVAKGERIGYAATYECPEDMPIGVAAIGYGDGYPRSAPSGTPVLVNAQRAALVGRVSMDLITIDLRNVPAAKVGDRVTLWGGDLPVEDIAKHAGTISYDLTCGMTKRVLFVEDDGHV